MAETPTKKPKSGWINVLVDYGPLLVFFLTYRYLKPDEASIAGEVGAVVGSTGAFVVAALIALVVSRWRLGKVSPMLWLSTALIVVFGGITMWTGDERVIQAKPTVIYLVFGVLLLIGWLRGVALLKILLEAA
ncbi:MAG TPA: septation protein IspZ, partial [Croceibacterium sp.]|nr:septation protein IspZ [Croceibacterium sp.]